MTAYRFVTLTCDECGEIFDPGTVTSVRECRRIAKTYRWVHDTRGDTCPLHNGYVKLGDHYYPASQFPHLGQGT